MSEGSPVGGGPAARFGAFVAVTCERGGAWGLWEGTWVVRRDGDEGPVRFPLWSAEDGAAACAGPGQEPRWIPLGQLLDGLLPELERRAWSAELDPTPDAAGVVPALDDLDATLVQEAAKY